MSDTQPISEAGRAALQVVLAHPDQTMLALDFDGTLAPIVDDPALAHVDPDALSALSRLGSLLGSIVVITGRPVRTAVRLGGFGEAEGLRSMTVLGQYGVERWDADGDHYDLPPAPPGIAQVNEELPGLLAGLGLAGSRIEDKGRAVAVHTRGLADPASAFDRLAEPIRELALRCGLTVEPGKNVWEIRATGIDKGDAMRAIVAEKDAQTVIFAGDDLGDLPAFEAVEQLRTEGIRGLLICSASHEEDALTEHADLVLDGPTGVAAWLHQLADRLTGNYG
ncbi:trehalose-phosphatase [Microlunatus phosphovorus]|uniref:trehalose-phosphatase n=1 Tax=Microlunatus phosphovorus TaxID=29405 RepID=UPI001E5DDED2|nr:trehalose-phosphatase [Microlunatus phosphovorus]